MYFIREERDNGQVFIHRYNRYRTKEEVLYFADRMWEQYISDNEKNHITSFCLMETTLEDPDGNDGGVVKQYKGNNRLHNGKEREL